MKEYVIFGDSEFAERIYKFIQIEKIDHVLCFTNEERFIRRNRIEGLEVVPFEKLSQLYDSSSFELLICIGYSSMNQLRNKIYFLCKSAGYRIGTWISSHAILYTENVAEGNIIMPAVLIGPSTQIGKCNILESRVAISHDTIIGDFNFISTNVVFGGNSEVANNCFIGLNSTIKSGIKVNDYSLIGSASNVIRNTEYLGVYAGNPAHRILGKISLDVKI